MNDRDDFWPMMGMLFCVFVLLMLFVFNRSPQRHHQEKPITTPLEKVQELVIKNR
jgi:Na+/melibiose symporter-like transporter